MSQCLELALRQRITDTSAHHHHHCWVKPRRSQLPPLCHRRFGQTSTAVLRIALPLVAVLPVSQLAACIVCLLL